MINLSQTLLPTSCNKMTTVATTPPVKRPPTKTNLQMLAPPVVVVVGSINNHGRRFPTNCCCWTNNNEKINRKLTIFNHLRKANADSQKCVMTQQIQSLRYLSYNMLAVLLLLLIGSHEIRGQCPWPRQEHIDLHSDCICDFNPPHNHLNRISIQCSPVNISQLLGALSLSASVPITQQQQQQQQSQLSNLNNDNVVEYDLSSLAKIDLLHINNSTIQRLTNNMFLIMPINADTTFVESNATTTRISARDKKRVIAIQSLHISRSGIETIEEATFAGLEPHLISLSLQDNLLAVIPYEAVNRLNNLKVLDLSNNHILHIKSQAFIRLNHLNTLRLADNKFHTSTSISNQAFVGLESNLIDLNLKNTQLNSIPIAIRHLDKLAFLNLAQNQISHIPAKMFAHMRSLTAINLERNRISIIDDDTFFGVESTLSSLSLLGNLIDIFPQKEISKLTRIRRLDMGFNEMKRIPDDTFLKNTILNLVALDGNPMETLPESAFRTLNNTLRGLSIGGRSLICDCRLSWILRWQRDYKLHITSRDRQPQFCSKPQYLRSLTSFATLPSEHLTCSPPTLLRTTNRTLFDQQYSNNNYPLATIEPTTTKSTQNISENLLEAASSLWHPSTSNYNLLTLISAIDNPYSSNRSYNSQSFAMNPLSTSSYPANQQTTTTPESNGADLMELGTTESRSTIAFHLPSTAMPEDLMNAASTGLTESTADSLNNNNNSPAIDQDDQLKDKSSTSLYGLRTSAVSPSLPFGISAIASTSFDDSLDSDGDENDNPSTSSSLFREASLDHTYNEAPLITRYPGQQHKDNQNPGEISLDNMDIEGQLMTNDNRRKSNRHGYLHRHLSSPSSSSSLLSNLSSSGSSASNSSSTYQHLLENIQLADIARRRSNGINGINSFAQIFGTKNSSTSLFHHTTSIPSVNHQFNHNGTTKGPRLVMDTSNNQVPTQPHRYSISVSASVSSPSSSNSLAQPTIVPSNYLAPNFNSLRISSINQQQQPISLASNENPAIIANPPPPTSSRQSTQTPNTTPLAIQPAATTTTTITTTMKPSSYSDQSAIAANNTRMSVSSIYRLASIPSIITPTINASIHGNVRPLVPHRMVSPPYVSFGVPAAPKLDNISDDDVLERIANKVTPSRQQQQQQQQVHTTTSTTRAPSEMQHATQSSGPIASSSSTTNAPITVITETTTLPLVDSSWSSSSSQESTATTKQQPSMNANNSNDNQLHNHYTSQKPSLFETVSAVRTTPSLFHSSSSTRQRSLTTISPYFNPTTMTHLNNNITAATTTIANNEQSTTAYAINKVATNNNLEQQQQQPKTTTIITSASTTAPIYSIPIFTTRWPKRPTLSPVPVPVTNQDQTASPSSTLGTVVASKLATQSNSISLYSRPPHINQSTGLDDLQNLQPSSAEQQQQQQQQYQKQHHHRSAHNRLPSPRAAEDSSSRILSASVLTTNGPPTLESSNTLLVYPTGSHAVEQFPSNNHMEGKQSAINYSYNNHDTNVSVVSNDNNNNLSSSHPTTTTTTSISAPIENQQGEAGDIHNQLDQSNNNNEDNNRGDNGNPLLSLNQMKTPENGGHNNLAETGAANHQSRFRFSFGRLGRLTDFDQMAIIVAGTLCITIISIAMICICCCYRKWCLCCCLRIGKTCSLNSSSSSSLNSNSSNRDKISSGSTIIHSISSKMPSSKSMLLSSGLMHESSASQRQRNLLASLTGATGGGHTNEAYVHHRDYHNYTDRDDNQHATIHRSSANNKHHHHHHHHHGASLSASSANTIDKRLTLSTTASNVASNGGKYPLDHQNGIKNHKQALQLDNQYNHTNHHQYQHQLQHQIREESDPTFRDKTNNNATIASYRGQSNENQWIDHDHELSYCDSETHSLSSPRHHQPHCNGNLTISKATTNNKNSKSGLLTTAAPFAIPQADYYDSDRSATSSNRQLIVKANNNIHSEDIGEEEIIYHNSSNQQNLNRGHQHHHNRGIYRSRSVAMRGSYDNRQDHHVKTGTTIDADQRQCYNDDRLLRHYHHHQQQHQQQRDQYGGNRGERFNTQSQYAIASDHHHHLDQQPLMDHLQTMTMNRRLFSNSIMKARGHHSSRAAAAMMTCTNDNSITTTGGANNMFKNHPSRSNPIQVAMKSRHNHSYDDHSGNESGASYYSSNNNNNANPVMMPPPPPQQQLQQQQQATPASTSSSYFSQVNGYMVPGGIGLNNTTGDHMHAYGGYGGTISRLYGPQATKSKLSYSHHHANDMTDGWSNDNQVDAMYIGNGQQQPNNQTLLADSTSQTNTGKYYLQPIVNTTTSRPGPHQLQRSRYLAE